MSVSEIYPYKFTPIYIEKIWGGRNLERLFARELPGDLPIGESWELADLDVGTSVVSNGPLTGTSLTELTSRLGADLLGGAKPLDNGRFPLLLKLLDANDILSLQVHPDVRAAEEIPGAALKTECWYVIDSRQGYIYKGLAPGVGPEQFREGIQSDTVEELVRRYDLAAGDFHYLPAGTVHAIGPGLLVAEVQTPSDTTYRVTDWGRGREIHVERSMQCIHFTPADDISPGAEGDTLLVTEFFTVARRSVGPGAPYAAPEGKCVAIMLLGGEGEVELRHSGPIEPLTIAAPGDTVVLPASLAGGSIQSSSGCSFLEITLPDSP
ncbi:MAG: class I mannose-6-phosphate isomerase [Phycisphaerae bacterium]|jgi:mannose-6-phosphate isomerase|nr:class I mannose-6-phosphate isomerase [Phycisphaerae bacterium]